jgi:hypothetical protein
MADFVCHSDRDKKANTVFYLLKIVAAISNFVGVMDISLIFVSCYPV